MNATRATIDRPTLALTTASDRFTASRAPTADATAVMMQSGVARLFSMRPPRAKRQVAERVMNTTANMLVATAARGAIPTAIIRGTLCVRELPPVMAPICAPVVAMSAKRMAICVRSTALSHEPTA